MKEMPLTPQHHMETLDTSPISPVPQHHTVVFDLETIPASYWSPPIENPDIFPPIHVHRVVCVGWVVLRDHQFVDRNYLYGEEREIIEDLSTLLSGGCRVVTFNGRRFDFPIFQMGALRHGINISWMYGKGYLHRYSEQHCDLYDQLSMYGACSPGGLSDIALSMGLPVKTGSGANVKSLWENGNMEAIGTYCMNDAMITSALYVKYLKAKGKIPKKTQIDWVLEITNRITP